METTTAASGAPAKTTTKLSNRVLNMLPGQSQGRSKTECMLDELIRMFTFFIYKLLSDAGDTDGLLAEETITEMKRNMPNACWLWPLCAKYDMTLTDNEKLNKEYLFTQIQHIWAFSYDLAKLTLDGRAVVWSYTNYASKKITSAYEPRMEAMLLAFPEIAEKCYAGFCEKLVDIARVNTYSESHKLLVEIMKKFSLSNQEPNLANLEDKQLQIKKTLAEAKSNNGAKVRAFVEQLNAVATILD